MSGPSNELTLRVGCTNAPPAPIGLTAQVSGTSIMITWQKSSGATGYVLGAGTGPGLSNIGSAPLQTNSLATTAPAGIYYVRVQATNKCGSSAPSNEVKITVVGAPTTVPAPPTTAAAPSSASSTR